VATVTIDRPPGNDLVPTVMPEVLDAMLRAGTDEEVRCIVLTGSGDYFSRGADLSRPGLFDPKTGQVDRALMKQLRADHRAERGLRTGDLLEIPVPVIAAINGPAAGAGLAITLQADIRIVAEDARFSFAFAQRGITAELGLTWLLPRMVGLSTALELVLTGRRFSGLEAVSLGLASRALPAAEVLPAAQAMAEGIARTTSPLAVAAMKRMLWANGTSPSYVTATRREKDVMEWIMTFGDAAEGMKSFLDKRDPQWTTTGREELPGYLPALIENPVVEY
jgi:enoyl-CoA hydratase/carnithine racemase